MTADQPVTSIGVCEFDDCDQTPIAGVSSPVGMTGTPTYVLIRRLSDHERRGQRVCLDHVHHLLDLTLMRQATP